MALEDGTTGRVRLALRTAVRDYLLADDNVTAVDFGLPEHGGEIAEDERAIRVHVRQKPCLAKPLYRSDNRDCLANPAPDFVHFARLHLNGDDSYVHACPPCPSLAFVALGRPSPCDRFLHVSRT